MSVVLPDVRGAIIKDAPLKDTTWFKVGGNADYLFKPADEADLAQFLKNLSPLIPVTILGLASNVIVRDGGIAGVVIRLGQEFKKITVAGDVITAGAAAVDLQVAKAAEKAGLTGVEFMSGIPGSVGGGLFMNAGAYGSEFKDVVIDARLMDRNGNIKMLSNAELGFSYRHSETPEGHIFLSARFQTKAGDAAAITAKMADIQNSRQSSQPIRSYTGGSTFANPAGQKAWQLIDAAGCRGLTIGGAQVSNQHCNFLINTGEASAHDLELLGETVRERVAKQSGVELRWEIKRLGKK
ncbi:MAG: UDP-N-acetylmuramate dehydrogenase [Alphaproteobacteria bacterium]|nr:UDP-N-acetylmuramate dehydrogenase [Alphaproteobacteria bacterium]